MSPNVCDQSVDSNVNASVDSNVFKNANDPAVAWLRFGLTINADILTRCKSGLDKSYLFDRLGRSEEIKCPIKLEAHRKTEDYECLTLGGVLDHHSLKSNLKRDLQRVSMIAGEWLSRLHDLDTASLCKLEQLLHATISRGFATLDDSFIDMILVMQKYPNINWLDDTALPSTDCGIAADNKATVCLQRGLQIDAHSLQACHDALCVATGYSTLGAIINHNHRREVHSIVKNVSIVVYEWLCSLSDLGRHELCQLESTLSHIVAQGRAPATSSLFQIIMVMQNQQE